ncbi:MAG: glycosyltransferase [Muribaculaceae bacterium]|nr:glycosyltransferase [Muribaculaceae bacterium]
MKISVIIPIYNVEQYIRRCIESVIAQTFSGEMECILVNDASPDSSMTIANQTLAGYSGPVTFRIVEHSENRGLSGARNTGARHATGDYIYFLDSDDAITPQCIETLARIARTYPGVDVVQGNLVVTDEIYRFLDNTLYSFPPFCNDKEWIQQHILTDIPVTSWNRLFRREFFTGESLWFKEGILHEDEHWRYIHGSKINSIAFCNTPTYIYYRNPGSIMETPGKDRSFLSMLEIFDEYLPTVTLTDRYAPVLIYIYSLSRRLGELSNPQAFMDAYHAFINRQLTSPSIPFAVKAVLRYMRHPSAALNFACQLFLHRAHHIIRSFRALDHQASSTPQT